MSVRRSRVLAALAMALMIGGCGADERSAPAPAPGPSRAERSEADLARARAQVAKLQDAKTRIEASQPSKVAEPQAVGPAGSAEIDGPAGSDGGVFSDRDRRSFAALATRLAGREGIAVSAVGLDQDVSALGELRSGVAWSTSKAPVAMAAIVSGAAKETDLRQAVAASDNAAAERLWSALGAGRQAAAAATAQLRAAGDGETTVEPQRLRAGYTAFGQTDWSLRSQVRFAAGMQCSDAGQRVLALMGDVVPAQRWGLGATDLPAQMKGGWGPGVSPGAADGWLDRQMGVVTIKDRPLAVALITDAPDHGTGTANLSALARWTTAHIRATQIAEPAC